MISTPSERYDLAEADLKSFTRSSIRTKVMLSLMEREKTASELEKIMKTRTSTILHSIKDLIMNDLIVKTNRGYSLTNVGRIQALTLAELVNTVIALNEHHDFWLNHDMSGIPIEMQKKIGLLAESEIIKDSPETPLRSLEVFIQAILKSKELYGVSPNTLTGYAETIASAVNNGAKVELILTAPVLNIVVSQHGDLLRHLLTHKNFNLFRIDKDVRVAFMVSDSFLNLGMTRLDGSYDIGSDLICSGESATRWGKMLFDYYRAISVQVPII